MDPTIIAAGAQALGAAMSTPPAGPSHSSGSQQSSYGGDGWVIAFSGATATGAPIYKPTTNSQDPSAAGNAGMTQAGFSAPAMLMLALLFGGLLWKKLNK